MKQKKGYTGGVPLSEAFAAFRNKVDKSKRPKVYRTNNPNYLGRICIDFYPQALPTIASFGTLQEAKDWIVSVFGADYFALWFPGGITEELDGQTYHVSAV